MFQDPRPGGWNVPQAARAGDSIPLGAVKAPSEIDFVSRAYLTYICNKYIRIAAGSPLEWPVDVAVKRQSAVRPAARPRADRPWGREDALTEVCPNTSQKLSGPSCKQAESMGTPCDRETESTAGLALEACHSFPVRPIHPSRPPPSPAPATHEVTPQLDSLRKLYNSHTSTSPGGTRSQIPSFVSWR